QTFHRLSLALFSRVDGPTTRPQTSLVAFFAERRRAFLWAWRGRRPHPNRSPHSPRQRHSAKRTREPSNPVAAARVPRRLLRPQAAPLYPRPQTLCKVPKVNVERQTGLPEALGRLFAKGQPREFFEFR